MKKRNMIILSLVLVSVLITGVVSFSTPLIYNSTMSSLGVEIPYTPSDMTKDNPNIEIAIGSSSIEYVFIEQSVDFDVMHSIEGNVTAIHEPLSWADDSYGVEIISIPVDILVKKDHRDHTSMTKKYNAGGGDKFDRMIFELYKNNPVSEGDTITVYVQGDMFKGKVMLHPYSEQFELGEDVIVHLGITIPAGFGMPYIFHEGEGVHYGVVIGENGKFKIENGIAYNHLYPYGKTLDAARYAANHND